MKKILIFILVYFTTFNSHSQQLYDLLNNLDKKIEMRDRYINIKESRIDSLCRLIRENTSLDKQYSINKKIFEEYYTYKYDSAMHYALKNKDIAELLENRVYKDDVQINLSRLLSAAGLVSESIDHIQTVERARLDSSLLLVYYKTMEGIYYTAKYYSNDSIYAPQYAKKERSYMDSIYNMLPKGSVDHTYYEGYRLFIDGHLDEAKRILTDLHQNLHENTRLYAIVSSNLASINRLQGNTELYEKYLILAAISDQVCALKENVAMRRLAVFLFQNNPEELTRAYRYINYSLEDAQFYNSRVRIVQIAQNMPIIISAYESRSKEENDNLKISLAAISILSILLIFLLSYVYRQIKLVKQNRKELYSLNEQLNKLNKDLHNANRIREESVSLFVDLSSSYINKMESFRETVKRKLLAKQIEDLYEISNSSEAMQSMQTSFLKNFDQSFLKLYPTFIDELNNLLSDEGKIQVKKGELLNPELRILALIKLGISDSSKIASFLHYSPQTIYNYKNKVKKYFLIDKDNYENYIKAIGEIDL